MHAVLCSIKDVCIFEGQWERAHSCFSILLKLLRADAQITKCHQLQTQAFWILALQCIVRCVLLLYAGQLAPTNLQWVWQR